MKKIIIQTYWEGNSAPIADGGYIPAAELAAESEHRMRIYADSIGADYEMMTEPYFKNIPNPGWNRFAMFFDKYDEYDEVLYVDADVLANKRALGVDIFTYPSYHLKVADKNSSWAEIPGVDPSDVIGKVMEIGEYPSGDENWMINCGVMKMNKKERMKMRWSINSKPYLRMLQQTGKNQIAFNKCFKKTIRRKPGTMSPLWNSTRPWYEPCFFKHYLGHQKLKGKSQFGWMGDDATYKEDWHNGIN